MLKEELFASGQGKTRIWTDEWAGRETILFGAGRGGVLQGSQRNLWGGAAQATGQILP